MEEVFCNDLKYLRFSLVRVIVGVRFFKVYGLWIGSICIILGFGWKLRILDFILVSLN